MVGGGLEVSLPAREAAMNLAPISIGKGALQPRSPSSRDGRRTPSSRDSARSPPSRESQRSPSSRDPGSPSWSSVRGPASPGLRNRRGSECSIASLAPSETELHGVGYYDVIDRYLPKSLMEDADSPGSNGLSDVENEYRRQLSLDPENKRVLMNYGALLYNSTENYTLASELLEKAVAVDPEDDDILNSYGHFFLVISDFMKGMYQQKDILDSSQQKVVQDEVENIFRKAIRWEDDLCREPSGFSALKARQRRLKPEALKGMAKLINKAEKLENDAKLRRILKEKEEQRIERDKVIQARKEEQFKRMLAKGGRTASALQAQDLANQARDSTALEPDAQSPSVLRSNS